jgi:hypothetical protein
VTRLADPAASRVVLVGGSRYANLPPLPTVANNLTALAALVADAALWGLPAAQCATVRDPATPQVIDAAVRDAATHVRPEGLLLFYFAGHGLIDPRTGALHLAVSGTDRNSVHSTAAPFEWVRRWFLDAPAGARVVILDCCYSGRATDGMGEPETIADQVEIDRTCVLVAAPANRTALAPPDEPFTAFTGVLIDVIRQGVAGGPPLLDLTTLFRYAVTTQRARNRPLPQLRARNGGENIPLVRNVAHTRAAGDDPDPPPVVRIPAPRPGTVLTPGEESRTGPAYGSMAVLAYDQNVGALGVRLGKRLLRLPNEVLRARLAAAIGPAEVYEGGPVGDVIVLLAELRPDAPQIPGVRMLTGRLATVPVAADPALVAAAVRRAWVFVGYLGWRPGQLEAELEQGDLVHSTEPLARWLTGRVD